MEIDIKVYNKFSKGNFWLKNMKRYFQMQNTNIVNVSKTLLETLNATENASENARLPNTN